MKGSTMVGWLPRTPMIWVSQEEASAQGTTSTPGDMTAVVSAASPHKRAERGFGRGRGIIRRSCGEDLKLPSPLLPHPESQCTRDTIVTSLAATRDENSLEEKE